MNPSLNIGHSDPRTEVVPVKYLRLAADLVATTRQDLQYWDTVPIPLAPSDRISFEIPRQIAVFTPLVPFSIAYTYSSFSSALISLIIALLIMRSMHRELQKKIHAKTNQWIRRDNGRYAFTQFLCNEFDLHPAAVTMKLVLKMCDDLKLLSAMATGLRQEPEGAARTRGQVPSPEHACSNAHATEFQSSTSAAATTPLHFSAATNCFTTAMFENDSVPQVNPASGLPMMDAIMDIHGNVYGTFEIDAMFDDISHVNSGSTAFQGGAEMHLDGIYPDFGGICTE